jgi:hypothetical protein
MQRGTEPLVDKLNKFRPSVRATVEFDEGIPLCHVTRHVECRQEHFPSFLGGLYAEELLTSVEPGQRVFSTIKGREQQFVAVPSGRDNGVTTCLRIAIAADNLLRLQPVDYHDKLALIALHGVH